MKNILINTKRNSFQEEWMFQLSNVITSPLELVKILQLDKNFTLNRNIDVCHYEFPFRVPKNFIKLMEPGNPYDPLLRQVLTTKEERILSPGFCSDPIYEHDNIIPGLLHKYKNRVLLLIKSFCIINCRYCFRKFFPYKNNIYSKNNKSKILSYINEHSEINEIIFSGGDPLMSQDYELDDLISSLEEIPHINTLRIHSRLLVIIPERITDYLCNRLYHCRFNIVIVTHINHSHEISFKFSKNIIKLKKAHITILNQSVLLKGVNDHEDILAELSEALFNIGILPYYLHMLDRVQGTSHFNVDDNRAKKIMRRLLKKISGYLVPKLVREVNGKSSKIPLDLGLEVL